MSGSRRATTTTRVAFTISCALAAAACSSGSDPDATAPGVTVAPPATDIVATLVTTPPATTSTAPSTTEAAVETTTTSSTTTIDPADAAETLRLEIEADLNEGEQAFLQAGAAPGSPLAADLARQFNSGPALEQALSRYEQFSADGLALRPSGEVENVIKVIEVLDVSDAQATVSLCRIDAAVKYVIPDSPDGIEIIVDDRVGRFLSTTEMVLEDGTWKIFDGVTDDLAIGQTSCDA